MGLFKVVCGSLIALAGLSLPAEAQSFPDKAVRIIVPYSPGGSPDVFARTISSQLAHQLKQPVIIENRPGANGTIGARAVAMATPDGYTLLLANSTFATNASSRKNLPYDPIKDFVPIAGIGRSAGSLMTVSTKSSIRTATEFINQAKRSKMFYASSGIGNSTHLIGALFAVRAGITLGNIPYPGAAESLQAVARGEVHTTFMSTAASAGLIRSGDLRPIGFTGDEPYPDYPEAPALSSVVPGYRIYGAWAGLLAPAGTPAEIVTLLNKAIRAAANDPKVAGVIRKGGSEPDNSSPAEFAAFVRSEIERWGEAFRLTGMEQR